MRNDMVFNGKVFDSGQIIDTFKFHLASWFKARWPDTLHSILDIVRFSKDTQVKKASKATKRSILWDPLPFESLKFNVDGAARSKPGPTGIGGVFRDCNAAVKAIFSGSIGVVDSNMAKLLAVREALKVFVASRWASSHRLIIESDSSNIVKWTLNPNGAPWFMKRHMAVIENYKQ